MGRALNWSIAASTAMIIGSTGAIAGGVERSNQSVAILFEQGNYLEFGLTHSRPKLTGIGPDASLGATTGSGSMSRAFTNYSFSLKGDINDQLSYAMILNEPIGAGVAYPGGTGYFIAGAEADLKSLALTGLLRYRMDNGFSAYGGLRAVRTSGSAALPLPVAPFVAFPYAMQTNTDTAFGYVIGVAYERPEIAARVSLTYNSRIRHEFDVTERSPLLGPVPVTSQFKMTIPESLHLEFQTGVAEGTLLFGGVRWVKWSDFDISPAGYVALTGTPLVSYPKNSVSYTLGLGRQLTEQLSGAVTLGYEKGFKLPTGNLAPYDGYRSIGLGMTYRMDAVRISGGVEYRRLGNATTASSARFTGNSALSAGVRIGMNF